MKKQLQRGDLEIRYLIRVKTFITLGSESLLIKTDEVETDSSTTIFLPDNKFLSADSRFSQVFEFVEEKRYRYNGQYLEAEPIEAD